RNCQAKSLGTKIIISHKCSRKNFEQLALGRANQHAHLRKHPLTPSSGKAAAPGAPTSPPLSPSKSWIAPMFEVLSRQPDDPLLALIGQLRGDSRPGKIDLGVGVYRDEAGRTPIFRAVKAAERRLWEDQDTKSYVGPEGDLVFL